MKQIEIFQMFCAVIVGVLASGLVLIISETGFSGIGIVAVAMLAGLIYLSVPKIADLELKS